MMYMIQARSDVGVEWLETLGPEVLRGTVPIDIETYVATGSVQSSV